MRARLIIGIDISEVMIEAAKRSPVAQTGRASLDVRLGDAEGIDLEDNSVDHVFSYALMKHLPPDVKVTVMREFARISTGRIAVSFGVFNPLGRLLWKMKGMHEWPVTWGDIQHLASVTSMDIGAVYKVGVPICGMEYVVVFERRLN